MQFLILILSFLAFLNPFFSFVDRKSKKEINSDSEKKDKDGAQQGEIKNAIYKNLMFNQTPQDLQKIIEDLPEGP